MTLLSCLYKSVSCDHSFKNAQAKHGFTVVHHDPSIVYFIYGGDIINDSPSIGSNVQYK